MTDKKPSTAEIMAMLRKKPADGVSASPAAPEAAAPAADVPAAAPASASAPVAPAAKPKGTADIMAAIRAKGAAPATAVTPAVTAPASVLPASSAAKPKGTSDIMAAIRAKGAAPASAPVAATASVAPVSPVAAAAPVATGKSPAEMIKAMRAGGAPVEGAAKAAAPALPKLPPKPAAKAPSAAGKKAELPRRSFPAALFAALCVPYYMGWTLLSLIGGVWGLGIARFMMPNTVLELPSKFKVGSIGDYPLGTVSEKYKASRGVWIVHTDSYDGQNVVYALLSICTHLGCTPSWLDAEQKFKCPCHGSGFYINGVNFEGPAPRPLERVGLALGPDGSLEVDKSIKFQEELGQWTDSKSFVKIS